MAAKAVPSLLPAAKSDFRSKDYWQNFFEQRGGKTFEWYGEWANFSNNVADSLPAKDAPVLIPGCGNSKLTEDLYFAGYKKLTSVDFDRSVIKEMSTKTAKRCPGLTWLEMDVKQLSFPDSTFQAVLDKGTLDALLPDDTPAAKADVGKYFSEVARVLQPGGVFLLVSLLQDHVLHWLASWHAAQQQRYYSSMDVHTFAVNDLMSPLCPFFIVLRKCSSPGAPALPVTVHAPHAFLAQDTTDTLLLGKSKAPAVALPACEEKVVHVPEDPSAALKSLTDEVHAVQYSYSVARQLQTVTGVTYLALDLWAKAQGSTDLVAVTPSGSLAPSPGLSIRYSVTVVDVPRPAREGGKPISSPKVGVVLLPLGREHEYSFCTKDGQVGLARQVSMDRLLFVCLGRAYTWTGVTSSIVREELHGAVSTMVPRACLVQKGGVPYLAVAQDLGAVEPVAEGTSALSGAWRVEDVPLDEEDAAELIAAARWGAEAEDKPAQGAACYSRRLVFASNQAAIQTETYVWHAPSQPTASTFSTSTLAFPYQQGMAGTVLALRRLQSQTGAGEGDRMVVLILGLGGGALASFLASSCPWLAVVACELDPAMVGIATQYFGLRLAKDAGEVWGQAIVHDGPAPGCLDLSTLSASALLSAVSSSHAPPAGHVRVVVGDALAMVRRLSEAVTEGRQGPSALIVDVDAKAQELKAGLSFPPLPFVARQWLACTRMVLGKAACGALLMNVGARSKALYAAALAAVGKEYSLVGAIATGDEDSGDLNAVVVGWAMQASEGERGAQEEVKAAVADAAKGAKALTDHEVLCSYAAEWLPKLQKGWR